MPMPLDKWQEHLEGHFAALAVSRTASGFPIFALEHGLTEEEFDDIADQLRARVAARKRFAPHWLLWAIYAAERGYSYTGGEYWPSFEESTPGWEYKDRYKLPGWFAKFQKTYNGVVPSGPWAGHFRIIAWPITQAVLPRYLQRHFAKALYELRFRLASLTSIDPAAIGRMIAANYHGSTRFEEFLQQEELVGRIVLALLHQDPREGEEPLLPSTLERITSDLERVRSARDWLKEASRVVTDRFKGIGRGVGPRGFAAGLEPGGLPRDREPLPDIRPDLQLRYAGNDTWTLLLDLPSFKSIAALNADIRQFLRRTRCSINGAEGKKSVGWVLSGNRRAVLKKWPDPEKPLVRFDQSQAAVDHLLETECRMTTGPVWLFRVGRDGLAREIAGRIMRPGQEYVIASENAPRDLQDGMHPCTIDCHGIEAVRVTVPPDVSADYIHWLSKHGLELARTIRVWPAGLPGRNWDGEGRSEWLTTEMPCLGIVPDHPVDSYVISLDGKASTVARAGPTGQPTFIRLPQLDAGTHLLTVQAQRSAALDDITKTSAHEGFVELRVREPEPWIPGTASHAGLIVTGDPHDAGLDTFWENRFNLSVVGPEHRSVTATVILEDAKGEEVFGGQVNASLELPITPDAWHRRFGDFLKREQCEWRYLEASAGILKINGQELGEFTLRFEHEAQPLRWVLRHENGRLIVRLVDDTGQEDGHLKCRYFSMEEPARIARLDAASALAGTQLEPPGGLFTAQSGDYRDTILVSAGLTGAGLEGLGVTPRYDDVRDDPAAVIRALRILRYWRKARLAGFVAGARRQQVMDGLLLAIYGILCGPQWIRAERRFLDNPNAPRAADNLQAAIGKHGGYSAVLRRDAAGIDHRFASITTWYADLAKRYGVCRDPGLCAFAIRLASQPHRLPRLFGDELEGLLVRLKSSPVLLRGARFLALLSATHDGNTHALLPEWKT